LCNTYRLYYNTATNAFGFALQLYSFYTPTNVNILTPIFQGAWMTAMVVTRVNPQFKCIANCAAQPVDSCADPSPPPPPPSPPPLADDDDAATGIRIVSAILGTVLALLIRL
jgi:hypothetical protein